MGARCLLLLAGWLGVVAPLSPGQHALVLLAPNCELGVRVGQSLTAKLAAGGFQAVTTLDEKEASNRPALRARLSSESTDVTHVVDFRSRVPNDATAAFLECALGGDLALWTCVADEPLTELGSLLERIPRWCTVEVPSLYDDKANPDLDAYLDLAASGKQIEVPASSTSFIHAEDLAETLARILLSKGDGIHGHALTCPGASELTCEEAANLAVTSLKSKSTVQVDPKKKGRAAGKGVVFAVEGWAPKPRDFAKETALYAKHFTSAGKPPVKKEAAPEKKKKEKKKIAAFEEVVAAVEKKSDAAPKAAKAAAPPPVTQAAEAKQPAAVAAASGGYDSMTVAQLKDALRERQLKLVGKKADLIQRLQDHDRT